MQTEGTYFLDEKGHCLDSLDRILPIPLYLGMHISLQGNDNLFEVANWNYHHGHPDEYAGLCIILKKVR